MLTFTIIVLLLAIVLCPAIYYLLRELGQTREREKALRENAGPHKGKLLDSSITRKYMRFSEPPDDGE